MPNEREQRFIIRDNDGIKGVSGSLIFSFRDVLENFALLDSRTGAIGYSTGQLIPDLQIFMACGVFPESFFEKGFVISKTEFPARMANIRTNRGIIVWDRSLSVPEAVRAIGIIDEDLKKQGLIDPDTLQREPTPFSYSHFQIIRQGVDIEEWFMNWAQKKERNLRRWQELGS